MATLNNTKFPNNSRIVSGVVTVYQDDSILLCNTTSGAVTINLETIPANYWNTTYKLYIVDNSNNASVNNITINAGAGQTINGSSSFVINSNGQSVLVRIISNNKYLASSSVVAPSGYNTIQDEGVALPQRQILDFVGANVTATDNGTKTIVTITSPPSFDIIDITYANFNALVVANTVQKGWFYRITDVTNADEGVIIQGTTTNTSSIQGSGIFYNADYQNIGNYSGVTGFVANIGVWNLTPRPVVVGDVVIYNNTMYKNLVGFWGGTPNTDIINWQPIAKSSTTGYIKEVDSVIYDLSNNLVIYRADKRGNRVTYSSAYPNALNLFKWGDNFTESNTVDQGLFNNCNAVQGIFRNNIVQCANFTVFCDSSSVGNFEKNVVTTKAEISITNGIMAGNFIHNFVSTNSGVYISNIDANSTFSENNIHGSSTLTIDSFVDSTVEAINIHSGGGINIQGLGIITNCYFSRLDISQRNLFYTDPTGVNVDYKTLNYSYSTFEITLDMNDASIWNGGTQTLTISNINKPFGIVTLLNCTGKTILKIDGVDSFDKIFIPNAGETVTFQHTLIGASVANNLVCDAPASANLLTGRANGSDFIVYKVLGARNLRTNLVLLA